MKHKLFYPFLFLCFINFAQINMSSLVMGSMLLKTPLSYVEMSERNLWAKYSAGALIDGTTSPWCSKNANFPFEFIIELAQESEIQKLEFNNQCENYAGIEAKEVEVEFSTTSANSGYTKIGTYQLSKGKTQEYEITKLKARWIKVRVLSNYGNKSWVELAEFSAYGIPSKEIKEIISIDGIWNTNWQNINFNQQGKTFTGSYSYGNVNGTVKNGKIIDNRIEFDWYEGSLQGYAVLYMNEEGNQLSGLWQNSRSASDNGLWTMTRKTPVPIVYEPKVILQDISVEEEKTTFEFNGETKKIGDKVVLKNILFKQSSPILISSSYVELDKLITFLKENENFNIELLGHTDNQGDEKLNLKLSEDRVKTVKDYLINNGITYSRIDGKGYGSSLPLTDNSTEELRKLNRRVEFQLILN